MTSLRINRAALDVAGAFFEKRGRLRLEGSAMLAGSSGEARRCVIPDQVGHRSALGVSVEVTMIGKLQLAAALPPDERYLARIHSHPAAAFHSRADDTNVGLTAEGSWSIVVADFGRGLRQGLDGCAVYQLLSGRWTEVPRADIGRRVVIVG